MSESLSLELLTKKSGEYFYSKLRSYFCQTGDIFLDWIDILAVYLDLDVLWNRLFIRVFLMRSQMVNFDFSAFLSSFLGCIVYWILQRWNTLIACNSQEYFYMDFGVVRICNTNIETNIWKWTRSLSFCLWKFNVKSWLVFVNLSIVKLA